MGKINAFYSMGKYYLKRFFVSSSKSVEKPASILAQSTNEPQKVTSKEIDAYYKRYGEALRPKQKKQEYPNTEKKAKSLINENEKRLQAETEAYNNRRFLDVSEEALKGLEHNFEEKKNKVIKIILSDSENLPKEYVAAVKQIRTPEELSGVIRTYYAYRNVNLNLKYQNILENINNSKKISLDLQKQIFKDEISESDTILKLIKAVTEPSVDKRVLQVEDFLKKTYGMDYVHLDNIEDAKNILRTIQLCTKHNIPLPKNIIITPFVGVQVHGQNLTHSATEYSIIISNKREQILSKKEAFEKLVSPELDTLKKALKQQDEKWFSTKDFLHIYVHEFTHSDQAVELLLPSKLKQIPVKYHDTIKKLGIYAQTSRRELLSELRTKSILGSINKDEKALLNYFG